MLIYLLNADSLCSCWGLAPAQLYVAKLLSAKLTAVVEVEPAVLVAVLVAEFFVVCYVVVDLERLEDDAAS